MICARFLCNEHKTSASKTLSHKFVLNFSQVNICHHGWRDFLIDSVSITGKFISRSRIYYALWDTIQPQPFTITPQEEGHYSFPPGSIVENIYFPIKQNEGRTKLCMSKLWLDFYYADFNFWTDYLLLQIWKKTHLEERKCSCSLKFLCVMLIIFFVRSSC